MTTAHAEPSAGDHAHHEDHTHAFDDEPIKTLPADEPRTPAWLPILGLLLFVGTGVALLVTGNTTPPPSAAIKLGPEQIQQLQQMMEQAKRGTGSAPVPVPAAPRLPVTIGTPPGRPGPPAPAALAH